MSRTWSCTTSETWGLMTGRRYHVLIQIGRREHVITGRIHVDVFHALHQRSGVEPVCFGQIGERAYWRLGNRWFWDDEGLSPDDVRALVQTRDQRRGDPLRRAHSTAAMASQPVLVQRGAIPADVEQLVWQRDRGQCRLRVKHGVAVRSRDSMVHGWVEHRGQPADPVRPM